MAISGCLIKKESVTQSDFYFGDKRCIAGGEFVPRMPVVFYDEQARKCVFMVWTSTEDNIQEMMK